MSARSLLAKRIRAARAVSVANDPQRTYRRDANAARLSGAYNRMFGLGKATKDAA